MKPQGPLLIKYFENKSRVKGSNIALEDAKMMNSGKYYKVSQKSQEAGSKKIWHENYQQIYRTLIKKENTLTFEICKREDFFKEEDLNKEFVKKFLENNFIQNVLQDDYFTEVGQERIEKVEFCTKFGAESLILPSKLLYFPIGSNIIKHLLLCLKVTFTRQRINITLNGNL